MIIYYRTKVLWLGDIPTLNSPNLLLERSHDAWFGEPRTRRRSGSVHLNAPWGRSRLMVRQVQQIWLGIQARRPTPSSSGNAVQICDSFPLARGQLFNSHEVRLRFTTPSRTILTSRLLYWVGSSDTRLDKPRAVGTRFYRYTCMYHVFLFLLQRRYLYNGNTIAKRFLQVIIIRTITCLYRIS